MRPLVVLTLGLTACAHVPLVPPGPMGVVRARVDEIPLRTTELILTPAPEDPKQAPPTPPPPPTRPDVGRLIARAARELLEGPLPAGFHDDCSGFACAAAFKAGLDLPPATRALWELAEASGAVHRRKRPQPGDLAFFDDTWDRDGDGRLDDPLTHVGVVVDVEEDGTIHVAHRSTSGGRTILVMNLLRPHDRTDESGKRLNDYLRRQRRNDPPGTRYLAGELWRGFATPAQFDVGDGSAAR